MSRHDYKAIAGYGVIVKSLNFALLLWHTFFDSVGKSIRSGDYGPRHSQSTHNRICRMKRARKKEKVKIIVRLIFFFVFLRSQWEEERRFFCPKSLIHLMPKPKPNRINQNREKKKLLAFAVLVFSQWIDFFLFVCSFSAQWKELMWWVIFLVAILTSTDLHY